MHKSIQLFEIENHFFYTSNYRQGENSRLTHPKSRP